MPYDSDQVELLLLKQILFRRGLRSLVVGLQEVASREFIEREPGRMTIVDTAEPKMFDVRASAP